MNIAKNFFFDTEFIEDGPKHPLSLLSIGIVTEDQRDPGLYIEVSDAPFERANDWVKANVLNQMHGDGIPFAEVGPKVLEWVTSRMWPGQSPQFWAYFADYDWVLFCQLFGRMIDLPTGWPMFCMDVKQYAVHLGNPRLPAKSYDGEHHALRDAEWVREAWWMLNATARL